MFRLSLSKETLGTLVGLLVVSALFLAYAVGGTRAAQLWCFLLPAAFFFMLTDRWSRLRSAAAWLLGLSCVLSSLDTGIRGFLKQVYQSDLLSSFVVESLANTHTSESVEYLLTVWPDVLLWSALTLLCASIQITLLVRCAKRSTHTPMTGHALTLAILVPTLLLSVATLSVRPWRSQLPVFSWLHFQSKVAAYHTDWLHAQEERRHEADAAARSVKPIAIPPRTVVLMVGESLTRDDMSLYGYERRTTPRLESRAANDPRFAYVRDAWSIDASTVASFRSMFDFRLPQDKNESTGNLFAFFRAAGYQITWISNQDDMAIKSEWMAHCDKQVVLNRLAGRSSRSMDDVTLAPLRDALADPAPHKLIVIHMIGVHPHFSLRYPEGLKPTWSDNDAITKRMKADNRSVVTQHARNEYDLAVLYQDSVLADALSLTEASSDRIPAFWLYLSDHGVETGNHADRTGHSQTTPSGYRIPLLLWADPRLSPDWNWQSLSQRSFRSDDLSALLLKAAGIELSIPSTPTLLDKDYVWRVPPSKAQFEPKP